MEILYTVEETAKILKTDKNYVYKLIHAGLLPVIKLKSYKVTARAIREFVYGYEGYDVSNPQIVKEINKR